VCCGGGLGCVGRMLQCVCDGWMDWSGVDWRRWMWLWMWMYVDVSGRRAVAVWRWSFEDLDGDLSRRPSWVARPQPNVTRPSPRPSPLSLPPSRIRISTRSLRRLAHGHAPLRLGSACFSAAYSCCISSMTSTHDSTTALPYPPLPPSSTRARTAQQRHGAQPVQYSDTHTCCPWLTQCRQSSGNSTSPSHLDMTSPATRWPPSPFRQAPASLDLAPYCAGNSHTTGRATLSTAMYNA
jgi:hypothetical protein